MFDEFFTNPGIPELLYIDGTYSWKLVSLSVCIAIVSSWIAMQVAGLAKLSETRLNRQIALLSGSVALGVGIWAMHFIGILAYSFCSTVSYDKLITALSMLPGILASWFALNLLSKDDFTRKELLISGTVMGAGIGLMHYSGMAAMRMVTLLRYDKAWFLTSLVVAVVFALLALWIRFDLQNRGRLTNLQSLLIGGLVMGLAISAMHYTGMAAARFIGFPRGDEKIFSDENVYMALAITIVTLVASVLALAGNALLRFRQLYGKVQESEERLKAIVNTAVDGIITIDARGTILAANAAAERLFGWKVADMIGRNVSMLMPEPHSSAHDSYISNFLRTGTAKIIGNGREVSARRADGSVFPIRLAVGQAQTDHEQFFVGFVTDISERVRMERELQERETKYRTLISNIPGVAFRSRVDENWTKIFISDSVASLTGWPRKAFMDGEVSYASLIHPNDISHVRDTVRDALEKKVSYSLEYRIRHKDGSERWLSESAGGVYDENGDAQWIDGVMIDITGTKVQAAEYQSIVYAMRKSLAVVEFDMQGNILDANDNYLKLTGYELSELKGKNHRFLCTAEETQSSEYQSFWQKLREGRFQSGEFYRKGKHGRDVWIQAAYNPIFDTDGKPWKIVKLAADLSPRKGIERDLISAKETAEQASAAKGMFLANMSHEIRTPMNAIIGFTDILLKTGLDDKQQHYLKTVRQSARSLLRLLNDILDTAKLERGAIELENRNFSLYDLCEQLISTFRLQADAKHLHLYLDYAATCPRIVCSDELRLRQILTNLLGNAVKFTEQGEVSLQVEVQAQFLHFTITDTGIGIPADRLDSIFAPFTQADASMSRRFGGTGLGTTIARQLIDLMGGRIEVSSVVGEGSRFEVFVPHILAGDSPATTESIKLHLPSQTILITDDVPENLELLKLLLEEKGHRITTAGGGLAAVQAFAEKDFDLILMDVQMPDIDGLEATRRITTLAAAMKRSMPVVIALTASVLSKDRDDAISAGMQGFATKPVDLPELEKEIARVLGFSSASTLQASVAVAAMPAEKLPKQAIDWEGALKRWPDKRHLKNAIVSFINNPVLLSDFQADAAPHDIRAAAHRVRGAAANLGLTEVAAVAAALEASGIVDAAASGAMLDAIRQTRAELELAESGRQAEPAQSRKKRDADVLPLLLRLEQAFRQNSFDDEAFAQIQGCLDEQSAISLQAALDEFDFEVALRLVSELKQTAGEL